MKKSANRLRSMARILAVTALAAGLLLPAGSRAQTGAVEPPVSPEDPLHATVWPDPRDPIVIGPRDDVGWRPPGEAGFIERLVQPFGGNGRPATRTDPAGEIPWMKAEIPAVDLAVAVRALWDEGGLLVSSRIDKHRAKGTFQAIFLEDCEGRRLYPAVMEIYELWTEGSDGVDWNEVTEQGRVSSSSHDDWRDDWSQDRGLPGIAPGGVAEIPPGIWQLTGFERAYGGVRQVGARFALDRGDVPAAGLALFVHVSRPKQNPVITEPVPFLLEAGSEEPSAGPTITPAHEGSASSIGQWLDQCPARRPAGDMR